MRVRTRVRRFSVHVRKCTYVQNVLPRETQDAPPFHCTRILLILVFANNQLIFYATNLLMLFFQLFLIHVPVVDC